MAATGSHRLTSRMKVIRVNGANPARVKRLVLQYDDYIMKPFVEIAVAVVVQQLMSGIFVTRVGIISVYPAGKS